MKIIDFISNAPCRDADPWLFDQNQLDLVQPGLEYCRGCSFWEMCESRVEPSTSGFDGICAGKVWRNGRILATLSREETNTLTIMREENDEQAVEFRGSQLLRD